MNQDDSDHIFRYPPVGTKRTANEVVDTGNGLNAGKTTSRDNKCQQRFLLLAAIAIGLLQVRDQLVPEPYRVAKSFHSESALAETRDSVKVRDTSKADNKKIEADSMLMVMEPVGNHDVLVLYVDLFNFRRQKIDTSKHFPRRTHNGCEIQIAGGHFVKHRCKQKEVIPIDERNLDRRVLSELLLELDGQGQAGKPTSKNEDLLRCCVSHGMSPVAHIGARRPIAISQDDRALNVCTSSRRI